MMRRNVIHLFLGYSVSFMAIGISYILYSRFLTPDEFGLYSTALLVGSFGMMLLDGGIKNTYIKSPIPISEEEEGTLIFLMFTTSIVLVVLIALGALLLPMLYSSATKDYVFLAKFGGIYILTYPFIAISTAKIEKSFAYGRIAWIESISTILERASPAFFLLYLDGGINSFTWGILLGRIFRVFTLNARLNIRFLIPSRQQIKNTYHIIKEGAWLQLATVYSLIRDNLHIILLGPLFGKEWIGYYAWCMQLCLIASQIFVQISARVSLPLLAEKKILEEKWDVCLQQIKMLSILTTPVLAAVLIVIPYIDKIFFYGRWSEAIEILPLLFFRMLSGISVTPLFILLMSATSAKIFAKVNMCWTGFEIILAIIFIYLIGATGLAWSYSIGGWVALLLSIYQIDSKPYDGIYNTIKSLMKRSSLAISVLSLAISYFITYYHNYNIYIYLTVALFTLILSYASEFALLYYNKSL